MYDPQQLNRYTFERNSPYNNVDEDGHWAHYALAGAVGFIAGSVGYMMTHSGSGWGHVGRTFAAGAIGAGAVMGTVAFATVGGSVAATKGAVGALGAAGKFLVGAGAEIASQMLDEEEIDVADAAIAGVTNLPSFGLGLRPGTKMGVKNIFSLNNLKLAGQFIAGSITNLFYSVFRNQISSNANQQSSQDKFEAAQRSSGGTSSGYTIGRRGGSTTLERNGRVVASRWGKYGRGTGNAYCKKGC